MRFYEHFAMRKLIGTKLKDYIRSNGSSKVAFCMKTEISRTTLDKILNGEIDNKSISVPVLLSSGRKSEQKALPSDKLEQ